MKDLKISKELLSEVLNYEVDVFLGINKNEIDYTCCRDENEGYIDISINLYEFAFKCKEWLKSKVSNLCSGFDNGHRSFCHIENLNTEDRFYEDSEIEAIIKACEWILSEVKK